MDLGSVLGTVGGVLGNAASGGLLGAALGIGSKFLQERQRQSWAKKEWDHELSLLKLQAASQKEESEAEVRVVQETGKWKALSTSIESDQRLLSNSKVSSWVLNVRSLWRPVLTAGLLILVGLLWRSLLDLLTGSSGGKLDFLKPEEVVALLTYIVHSVVFAANTAALWWFADRASSMPQHKQH